MITQLQQKAQKPAWQSALKAAFTDPVQLLEFVEIEPQQCPWLSHHPFQMKVPRHFAEKIRKGDPNDPILRQVLPLQFENEQSVEYVDDPLAERAQNPLPGLIHKFKNRVLVIPATECPIHCRYCFRRHFPYDENNIRLKQFEDIAAYIAADLAINEVILSGGDPLYAPDRYLKTVIDTVTAPAHVTTLRIHSRFPITLPERIDSSLIDMLSTVPKKIVLVTHCNHPQELCSDVKDAITRLKAAGVTVLNQGVILHDINDSVACLTALSQSLFATGILPYYMNELDKVAGVQHFAVPKEKLKTLYRGLLTTLPGYLVPRFVQEQPFEKSKIPLSI